VTGRALVGRTGSVTVRVPGGDRPGEVRLVVQGIPHHYIAYCREPLAIGDKVLVVDARGARQVDVTLWP
jgi:membrane protein implicated in regulation of membrane protease activity